MSNINRTLAVIACAQVCHEANRAWCATLGDTSQLPWAEAPEWQRVSAMNGVKFHLANPDAGQAASHVNWMAEKVSAGWTWGPEKDPEMKLHPCIVPYEQLPADQKMKDAIFVSVVHGMFS